MSSNLETINRIIDEHRTIGEHIKLLGESVTDEEARNVLETARADWIPGRPEAISEKQNRLQKALSSLKEGLKNHFIFEEQTLPPLLGELLMHAIVLQHGEIERELTYASSLVSKIRREGLNREELLAEESRMQQTITMISQLVEDHAAKEEMILDMAQMALRDKG